jgi:hypothetical protein
LGISSQTILVTLIEFGKKKMAKQGKARRVG